jgi:hypothetical protein
VLWIYGDFKAMAATFLPKIIDTKVCGRCCGSGIRCLIDPWIRNPEWVKKSGSGSGMNNPDLMSESLEKVFSSVKILKFFDADPVSGMEKIRIRDP